MRGDLNTRVVSVLDSQFTCFRVFPNLGAVVKGHPVYATCHKHPIDSELQAVGIGLAADVRLVCNALLTRTHSSCRIEAHAT